MRPERADLQRLDGKFQVVRRAGGRGEMQHGVHVAGDIDDAGHVLTGEAEARMREQVGDVRFGAGEEIIEAEDVPAPFEEQVAQMRAEKPCPAGYHCAQWMSPVKKKAISRRM